MFIKMVALCGECGYIFNDFAISENKFEYSDGRVESTYSYHPDRCPICKAKIEGVAKDVQFPEVENKYLN